MKDKINQKKSLSEWICKMPFLEKRHFRELTMTGLSFDSRSVKPGHLFVAIAGLAVDGHGFILEALTRGATAVVVERNISVPTTIPVFKVKNSREALSYLAASWWGNPADNLHMIGITGTNGKTTTSFLIEAILNACRKRAGRIGTIGYAYNGEQKEINHTTPEAPEIHQILSEMQQSGITHVAMEVSSHAIDLNRCDDIAFDQAIFTNLTPEHLDYHKSMELYFETKKHLFTHLLAHSSKKKHAILNIQDVYGKKLFSFLDSIPTWTFTTERPSSNSSLQEKPADFYPLSWQMDLSGIQAQIQTPGGACALHSPLIGIHNLANLIAALAASFQAGMELNQIKTALSKFGHIPGRLERIENCRGLNIFVDYAHTPDALKHVLSTLRNLNSKSNPTGNPGRIITVFGCGGDRDREKRPLMGKEVARFSDFAIITSDNPRTEDPEKIISDILPGIEKAGMRAKQEYDIIPDRREAIAHALSQAKSGDVVLVAGKGHENYQILGTKKVAFDDREVVKEFL